MKSWIFTIAAIISAAFYCPISFSIENPGIGNPIGPSTVPPSTINSGLVSNPSPIDMNGNLLITGNVRRGRYFHGDVPYRSPTSFGSSLGSSALSSFLRDTAGSEDFQTNSNKYGTQPYYSPTETVTTMMPGRSKVFSPASTRISTRVQQDTRIAETDGSGLEFQPVAQSSFGQSVTSAGLDLQQPTTQYGTLAQSRLMLESKFPTNILSHDSRNTGQLMPAQIGMRQQGESSDGELFKEQLQDITGRTQSTRWPGIDLTTGQVPERQGDFWEKDESFKYPNQETSIENLKQKYNVQTYNQALHNNGKQTTSTHQGISALEQFKPSTDIASQKTLFVEKGTNWSAAKRESQTVQEPIPKREQEQSDVFERIRQQLDDLTKSLNETTQGRDAYKDLNTETTAQQEKASLGYKQYLSDSQQVFPQERVGFNGNLNSKRPRGAEIGFEEEPAPVTNGGLNRADRSRQAGLKFSGISNYMNSQKKSSPLQQFNQLTQAEISAEANRIMAPYNSLESLSGAKFNQHMDEAEEHLKAGRYYRAASSFSLALIYQAGNPQALAGRGHALLAVGEYVSSSLFLSRALEVSPEYLQTKVDLAAVLGGENKLADRIADIEQWLARSDSSQLQFLLGYVYYRTGQLLRAKQEIDAAYKKTPDSPSVQVMKITIDNMIIRQ